MKTKLIVVLILAIFLAMGCTVPVRTKVEMHGKQVGASFVKKSNYLVLARYWDYYAEKQMIDYKPASFLTVHEKEGRAEITIGNGPYYGMIELNNIDSRTTLITTYAWGGMAKKIFQWQELIRGYSPEKYIPAPDGTQTYSQILSTYPANAELCGTVANIMGGNDRSISLGVGAGEKIGIQRGQTVYKCYGTKLTVKVTVTLNGKTYKPGTKLTVGRDLEWIEVSSWD